MNPTYLQVPPARKAAWVLLLTAGVALPLGIMAVVVGLNGLRETAEAVSVGLLVLVPVMGYLIYTTARHHHIRVDDQGIEVRAAMYRKQVAFAEIRPETVRVLDIASHPELRPWLKTNGVGLPGLQAGHFRLRNKDKAFLMVTDPKVLAFQLQAGNWVMVSVRSPELAAKALQDRLAAADKSRR